MPATQPKSKIQTHSPHAGALHYPSAFLSYSGGSVLWSHPFEFDNSKQIYLQGKIDGRKDLQEEVVKMAAALFEIAQKKADFITVQILEFAAKNNIRINRVCLKIANWEKISMLILVDLDDYVNEEKMDLFYREANSLCLSHNDETFIWEYVITYFSEDFSIEKVISEGYNRFYDPPVETRPPQ